jgi:hypothetical protein
MSKLITTSTCGMSRPRLATSVAIRIDRVFDLNLLREPRRFDFYIFRVFFYNINSIIKGKTEILKKIKKTESEIQTKKQFLFGMST